MITCNYMTAYELSCLFYKREIPFNNDNDVYEYFSNLYRNKSLYNQYIHEILVFLKFYKNIAGMDIKSTKSNVMGYVHILDDNSALIRACDISDHTFYHIYCDNYTDKNPKIIFEMNDDQNSTRYIDILLECMVNILTTLYIREG